MLKVSKFKMVKKPNIHFAKECYDCYNVFAKPMMIAHDDNYYCSDCFNESFAECTDCGDVVKLDDLTMVCDSDGRVCESCLDDYSYCEECSDYVHGDAIVRVVGRRNDEYVCEYCVDHSDNYGRCHDCGEYCNNNNMIHGDNFSVGDYDACGCSDNYYRCEDCGDLVHSDNVYYDEDSESSFCEYCYNHNSHGSIHDYGYKPSPQFNQLLGEDTGRFFGIELEIDGAGKSGENASQLLDALNSSDEDIAYFKSDGSLSNGMELVTHPMSMGFFEQNFDVEDFCDEAKRMGYKSHDTETCGLHVHISRKAFGDDVNEQTFNIAKLLVLFENNFDFFLNFSRRTESKMRQWASRYGLDDGETPDTLYRKATHSGRYHAINLQNRSTVELRFFRGTLNHNTIKATMQFINGMMDVITEKSIEYVQGLDFVSMIENIMVIHEDYTELVDYLVERKILEA